MTGPVGPGPAQPRVVVIGRPGCHLCDEAEAVVDEVCRAAGLGGRDNGWAVRSIDDDPELHAAYWELIPVVLVDGRQHTFYHVDPERLRAALR